MNIYFCGSIRGGRQDAALYRDMITLLKTYGVVLTEHVGDGALTERGGDGGSADIWRRDTDWLRQSDIVIAECSTPSLGVGYELATAEALGKPVHVFYGKPDGRLSAMIGGDPHFAVHFYESRDDLFAALHSVMRQAQAADRQLLPAYDRIEELRPLYKEYAEMLLACYPAFAPSLTQQNYDEELSHLQDKYGLPRGRIYVLHVDGRVAGCVALKPFDDTRCELKRLYIRPAFRGARLGEWLVQRIIADAREIGYRALRLDTLPPLKTAIALYRELGFVEIAPYYDCLVPNTVFLELPL